ncbi:hypothetical protein FUAX_30700 [Fulvitalea axinellae]|uniref:DinB-like domain-containing protein n=1 Tax=Fulvitalea axinellae TaxID=1182444 RepID=A0AAU9CRB1_9BACT|nr:hypothetical protein FUAX_30700 [Fulvitalea axinellae]
MNKHINNLIVIRKNFLDLADGLSLEQLNLVPEGFTNNIIWNIGHSLVTQQMVTYKLAGHGCHVDGDMIRNYRKDSSPSGNVKPERWAEIRQLLIDTPDQLSEDLKTMDFSSFHSYTTSFGVTLESIEDAMRFNNIHESLHYGYALALRKAVLALVEKE